MKTEILPVSRLLSERLLLIPFTLQLCRNLIDKDYSDLPGMGIKKGKGWPDKDVIETLPRIADNLLQVEAPTGFESWMIIKKDTMEIIGDAGFKGFNRQEENIDIGYGIIEAERRKGYAEEAVVTLIRWAFSQRMVREITARCETGNTASIRLLEKIHFTETKKEEGLIQWSLRNNLLTEQV